MLPVVYMIKNGTILFAVAVFWYMRNPRLNYELDRCIEIASSFDVGILSSIFDI